MGVFTATISFCILLPKESAALLTFPVIAFSLRTPLVDLAKDFAASSNLAPVLKSIGLLDMTKGLTTFKGLLGFGRLLTTVGTLIMSLRVAKDTGLSADDTAREARSSGRRPVMADLGKDEKLRRGKKLLKYYLLMLLFLFSF